MNHFFHRKRQLEDHLLFAFLHLASYLVPSSGRTDWRAEWEAELWARNPHIPSAMAYEMFPVWSLVRGIVTDAAWFRVEEIRNSGSASWCLQMLLTYCVICAVVDWLLAGSWRTLRTAIGEHFFGCFVYVVLPGTFVAVASSPLRPRKCDRQKSRLAGLLSANSRWNLFLSAKLLLTLAWSFLISAVIASAAYKLIGHLADWVELISTALAIILSLRWALLEQEHRCQHCLRMLSQPTRVGFASRNFLDWNGTELICTEGHGLLHVTQMQGSWCWYDLWVELDPTWQSLFSPQRAL